MTITADDLITRLHDRFSSPEWASFSELRDRTGFSGRPRTIDFFALNTYPSKRFRTVAVEVKVSRSDFMREIDNPDKRETFESQASEFWFCCPAGLVKPDEVPEGCGLLETRGDGLVRRVAPRQDMNRRPSERLWVSLIRRAGEQAENARARHERDEVYATLGGRPLTLSKLKTLVEHSSGRISKLDIDAAVRQRMTKQRTSARSWAQRWEPALKAIIAHGLGRQRWNDDPTPEKVIRALDGIRAARDVDGLVTRLRQAADDLEKHI